LRDIRSESRAPCGNQIRYLFAAVDDVELQHDIDAAYHSKYDHYPKEFVDPVVGEHSYEATIRLVPREP